MQDKKENMNGDSGTDAPEIVHRMYHLVVMELRRTCPHFLRQTVKARFSANGELSLGLPR